MAFQRERRGKKRRKKAMVRAELHPNIGRCCIDSRQEGVLEERKKE